MQDKIFWVHDFIKTESQLTPLHGFGLGERSSGGIWKRRTSSFKCYVDHSHTMYSSGNIDVRNWVHLFQSRSILFFSTLCKFISHRIRSMIIWKLMTKRIYNKSLFKIQFFHHREQTLSPVHHTRKMAGIAQDHIKTSYNLCGDSAEGYPLLLWLSSFNP